MAVGDCLPPDGPPPVYPKFAGSLSEVAELYERGASVQSAAGAASVDDELREDRLCLRIPMDRDPRELVIWLNDNGALVNVVGGTDLVDDEWAVRNNSTIDAEYRIILLSEYLKGEAEPEEPYGGGIVYIGASCAGIVAGSPFGAAGGSLKASCLPPLQPAPNRRATRAARADRCSHVHSDYACHESSAIRAWRKFLASGRLQR